jgi:hypothetical protein
MNAPVREQRSNGATAARDPWGRKQCICCQEWLDPDQFMSHGATVDGKQVRCRACTRIGMYHLTPKQVAETLERQANRCAICATDIRGRYTIDHNHSCCPGPGSCGKCVRGFLCDACNHGLGSFRDSTTAMENAIRYLRGGKEYHAEPFG